MPYAPPRQTAPQPTGQPLEVDLVFNVRPCGTCDFFWPADPTKQPYGPYPAYDFKVNTPGGPDPAPTVPFFNWVAGTTRPPAFPNPEVMDGCRKAPIMTIGINPNLTAFAPGVTGTSWCYPHFASDDGTDEWVKYAYYYRYRSVFQERFNLDFVTKYLLPEPRVVAPRPGSVVSADRTSSAPAYTLKVRYDGDLTDTEIPLDHDLGTPRWVILFNPHAPHDRFAAGDVLAGRLNVPAGQPVEVVREQIGYYEQFVPVLDRFQSVVQADGHPQAAFRMGEDVCQLDMVACASPHWAPPYLGNTPASEQKVIDNCVSQNAWAMKQFVQTRPAVLYLVGESTWNMFRNAFGALVKRELPLTRRPADGAFTLLRETTDPKRPAYIKFATTVDGTPFEIETRLVITPHFSYSTNFIPQFRMSRDAWQTFQSSYPNTANALSHDARVTSVPGVKPGDYDAFLIAHDAAAVRADLAKTSADGARALDAYFVDAHQRMADVLADLYGRRVLTYGPTPGGTNVLTRTAGSCRFCVNDRWQFPQGCEYGKPDETPPPTGFLEKVTAALVSAGRPAPE